MKCVVDEHQHNWDVMLPYVMAAFRSSTHKATRYTPNYLMLGREVRAPVDVVYGLPPSYCSAAYDDYASEMDDRLRLAYTLVREHLHVAAERNKRCYDLWVRSQRYEKGDWVYYYNPRKYAGRQDKWRRKFSGLFLVTQIVGPVNVMLQQNKRHRPFCVHIDKIKPYEAEIMPKSWLNADASDDQLMMSAGWQPERSDTPAPIKSETEHGMAAIAEIPPAVQRTPRPKRDVGRPRRYLD